VLRRPLGIYATVKISDVIAQDPGADWTSYFDCYYAALLANPAVSGLTVEAHWDVLEPSRGLYDFRYVQAAFDQVVAWNTQSATQKTIQLVVTPGFDSPQWVLDEIDATDGACDGLFPTPPGQAPPPAAGANCGTVTFVGYNENTDQGNTLDGGRLPLPWDATYLAEWQAFLSAFAGAFGDNPALTSIAIGGPSAGSCEMILPSDGNTCPCHATSQGHSCAPSCPTAPDGGPLEAQPNTLYPNQMWNLVLANHFGASYPTDSNQAFVEAWESAIDFYEATFSNLTLVLTPANGDGLPFRDPGPDAGPLCSHSSDVSCAATVAVIGYFEADAGANGNGKGVQVSGLGDTYDTLKTVDVNIGGIRFLTATTAANAPTDQLIGGAEFDHTYSKCLAGTTCPTPIEQEEFDVLATFFNGTEAIEGTASMPGLFAGVHDETLDTYPLTVPAPLNYLQVYNQDIIYSLGQAAADGGCSTIDAAGADPKTNVDYDGGATLDVSAQDLLNQASQLLAAIGEPPPTPPVLPAYPAPMCPAPTVLPSAPAACVSPDGG
jgi:hypothetical protein